MQLALELCLNRQIHEPLHVAVIGDSPIRFFDAKSGRPELPWVVLDDIAKAAAVGEDARTIFQRGLKADWNDMVRTIATRDGVVTIGPHAMAQGFLAAVSDLDAAKAPALSGYIRGAVVAMKALTAGLSIADRIEFAVAAASYVPEGLADEVAAG